MREFASCPPAVRPGCGCLRQADGDLRVNSSVGRTETSNPIRGDPSVAGQAIQDAHCVCHEYEGSAGSSPETGLLPRGTGTAKPFRDVAKQSDATDNTAR
jgi:hypothetical protein